ncbi:hypothetical protein [Botrimarina mediterranea]|nr:hypothetical protein K2D_17020 [Planctomycetes bacterium K2D]
MPIDPKTNEPWWPEDETPPDDVTVAGALVRMLGAAMLLGAIVGLVLWLF